MVIRYWLYLLTNKSYYDFVKYYESTDKNSIFITTLINCGMEKDDVLFIYKKYSGDSGFVAYARIGSTKDKPNIKIFRENNMNRHTIKLKTIKFFNRLVKIKELNTIFNYTKPGYKSVHSFISKFMRGNNCLTNIEFIGDIIHNKLIELYHDTRDSDSEQVKQKKQIKHKKQTKQKKQKADNKQKKQKEDNKQKEQKEDNKHLEVGMVPIMMIPCKRFKLDGDFIKDNFKKHYMSCRSCEIVNNGRYELSKILDDARMDIVEVVNRKDINFNPVISAYNNIEGFALDEDGPSMRIFVVNNGHKIYDGCMLITWVE